MAEQTLLDVRGLKTYYPVCKGLFKRVVGHVKAVDGVDFRIQRGETFGLVGESGCGKTTIGKTILRLADATAGEIIFDGKDLLRLNAEGLRAERRNMQIIFQDPFSSLNPRMTVGEIIGEPLLEHAQLSRAQRRERVLELMRVVGLNPDQYKRYPHEFSGGQRQRIGIAKALALRPKLIVCDEPVSALDVSIQSQILNLLEDVQKEYGVAYLFIAHGMAVVRHISDRVGVMYLGKIVEVAGTDNLFDECMHPYTKALMRAIPIPDVKLRKEQRSLLQGEVPNPVNPPNGCRFHPRCAHHLPVCECEEPALSEVSPGHFVACHCVSCAGKDDRNELV